jgi:hypothetical protein
MRSRNGLAAAAAALLAAAACGSSPSAPPVAGSTGHAATVTTAATTAQKTRAWLDFAACMRAHGANLPDPSFNQEGSPQWSANPKSQPPAALVACQSRLPAVDSGKPDRAPTAADLAQAARFAQCMRQHGVPDFPDPDPRTGGFVTSPAIKNAPGLDAAETACRQFNQKGKG